MNLIRRFIKPERLRELSLLLIIILSVSFFNSQIENYNVEWRFFYRVTGSIAVIAVVAVGQTLVVLTRNIDLSVGAIVGFTAFFIGRQASEHQDLTPVLVVALAMGAGALMGLGNGLLVAYAKIPAIVVTLGTMALYRGILFEYSDASTITTRQLPDWIKNLPRDTVYVFDSWGGLEIRTIMVVAVAAAIIFQFVLSMLPFGRQLYAIGSNPDTAQTAGIPARRTVTLAYVLCGALSGLGGFLFLARQGTISIEAGGGLELDVVAAVVVGGVNIFGGSGTIIGAMLGAILIGIFQQSLIRLDINEFWKDALLGVFILIAVAGDSLFLNRLRALWSRSELKLRTLEQSGSASDETGEAVLVAKS
jgi:rhamnose transport system permease protein